jgi:hypothetical protein
MKVLVAVALGVLFCGAAQAAELHVSPQGKDTNPGSSEAPFLTIQAGVNAAKPGDSVLVGKGIYREKVTVEKSGQEGRRLVIRAVPRRAAILEGFTIKGSYLTVEGFQITHMFSTRVETGLECQGDFNEILDNYVYDCHREGISAGGQNHVARNKIYKINKGIVAAGNKWVFEYNEVSRLYNWGEEDGDYARFFGEDGVWRGNFFHGNLQSERNGHPDTWQTFDSHGEIVHNILFERNIVGDIGSGAMLQAWYHRKSSDLLFRNNVFFNLGQGLSGSTISNITAVNNVFYNVHGTCVGGGPGSIARNNIYYNCGEGSGDYCLKYNTRIQSKTPGAGGLVNVDPMFVDPQNLDFRLKPGSPAIDAGDPNTPVPPGGGKRIDIGAYEYGTEESKEAPIKPLPWPGAQPSTRPWLEPAPVTPSPSPSPKASSRPGGRSASRPAK